MKDCTAVFLPFVITYSLILIIGSPITIMKEVREFRVKHKDAKSKPKLADTAKFIIRQLSLALIGLCCITMLLALLYAAIHS